MFSFTRNKKENFLILAEPRSGSTNLRICLNRQPNVCCHGEVLGFRRVNGFARICIPPKYAYMNELSAEELAIELKKFRECPRSFMNRFLYNTEKSIVGIKTVSFQLEHPQNRKFLRKYLTKNSKIIVLRRKNKAKRYVSSLLQRQYGLVKNSSSHVNKDLKVRFDVDEFEKECVDLNRHMEDFLCAYRGNPCLDISYESLFENETCIREVFKFLNLPENSKIKFAFGRKVNSDRLGDLILNFDEVSDYLESEGYDY